MKVKRRFNRIKALRIIAVVLFLVIFGRLSWLQGVEAASLKTKAVKSRTTDTDLMPQRGNILDGNGRVLATSIATKTVFIQPNLYKSGVSKLGTDPTQLLTQLAQILQLPVSDVESKCNSGASWVALAHQVSLDKAASIEKLNIPGIGFSDDTKRVYPMGSLMGPVLGFVKQDGRGADGLELSYDKYLYGQKGFISAETDARSRDLIDGVHSYEPPQNGDNLVLTIDSNIQYIVEQQIDQIMKDTQPLDAVIIVMDPNNGKIVAMANRPTFDPNNYAAYPPALWNNQAVSWQYEPGSTFKIITSSAAMEEGTSSPDKLYNDPGYLKVQGQTITNWNTGTYQGGMFSLTKGMEMSSNVVLGQVALEMGVNRFYKYLRGFGFGKPTGVDLPGEAWGQVLDQNTVSQFELATMGFGQANAVTPLQLITAISAVANGGTLYKPYVVDKVLNPDGQVVLQNKPEAVRQVISQTTADLERGILEKVVTNGTGQNAEINGYVVAGKTGTAQKVMPDGKYSPTDYIASFAGFAPADHPRLVTLVVVDSPKKALAEGAVVAAPYFHNIMQQALAYYNVPPNNASNATVPSLPPSPTIVDKPVVPQRSPGPGEGVVPDLTGKTMSEVGQLLSQQGLRMNFTGTGMAASQSYPPGAVVAQGTVVNVNFSP